MANNTKSIAHSSSKVSRENIYKGLLKKCADRDLNPPPIIELCENVDLKISALRAFIADSPDLSEWYHKIKDDLKKTQIPRIQAQREQAISDCINYFDVFEQQSTVHQSQEAIEFEDAFDDEFM